MVFSVSPSVTIKEVDLTTSIPAITTPPAAIAGVFHWGPTNERVLISSEVDLVNTFGKPSDFNAETFFTAVDFLAYSNALYVTRVVSDDAENASAINASNTELFEAKYPGVFGNNMGISYVSTSDGGDQSSFSADLFEIPVIEIRGETVDTFNDLTVSTNEIAFNTNTFFIVTEEADVDVKEGDVIRLGSQSVGYQELVVASVTETSEVDANTSIEIFTYKVVFENRYALPELDASNLTFSRLWKYSYVVDGAPIPGHFHIIVTDSTGDITGIQGQILERFENVSVNPSSQTQDGTSSFYKNVLQNRSRYIKANETNTINVNTIEREYLSFSGGLDGESESSASMFGKIAQGYDLYKEANDVDIAFVLQGKANSPNLANYIVSNISEYRKDCVAYLSPRKTDVVDVFSSQAQLENVISYRNAVQNSSYWFMDSGYKYRYDKYNDVYRWVPLNGDMAGLSSRVEPWESPAGYRKGRIRNVVKLAFNPNKTLRDQLFGRDINPVISQVGQGTILFGDKTGLGTASGSAFTRLNVRRLFITIEKVIATVSAQFLFEFNDEFTQNQFRQVVDPFLRDIQGRRGIIDFRVISDATINTPDVVDANIFKANIFVKPSRTISFIELTFVATRTGISFEEIVGQQF